MNPMATSKEEILKTSRVLIQQNGWEAVNIRAVAAACGVSVGCIYNYFGSKTELVSAAVESIWSDIFRHPDDPAVFEDTLSFIRWMYRQMIDAMVVSCAGQGQISAQRVRVGVWNDNAHEIAEVDREGLTKWRAGQEPGGDVETREACGRRVVESIADWSDRLADHDDAVLVIVSHGGAISNGIMSLLGTNPSLSQPLAGMDNCHWADLAPQANRTPACRLMAYNLN